MRTPVVQLTVLGTADQLALFRAGSPDLCAAGSVEKVTEAQTGSNDGFRVEIELGDPPPKAPA